MFHLRRFVIGAVAASVMTLGWFSGIGSGSATAQDQQNRADWQAKILERHPEADTDGDGVLTREEIRAFHQARRGQYAGASTKGKAPDDRSAKWRHQGRFGPPDPALLLQKHPELDTNKDGVLSDEEMRAARETLGPQGPDGLPFRPHPAFFDWIIDHFEKADLDGNKQLSKEELLKLKEQCALEYKESSRRGSVDPALRNQRLLKRFPEADTDGDGKLSDEEFQALRQKSREKGSHKHRGRSREQSTEGETGSPTE